MKHVLVTGGNGQLGTELKRYAWPEGWAVTAIDIDEARPARYRGDHGDGRGRP
ncbi:sugar nucleotide-binding protein [Sphingomonas aurantiaca]|uniref:hypothetical protein n=1 Tax=Sphingomonas aurantiaca TaxID=185949 RepID=UPI002FE2A577